LGRRPPAGLKNDAFRLPAASPIRARFDPPTAARRGSGSVTDQSPAPDALRESEARYRSLFDLAPIGIYQCLADGTFVAVNRTLATLLGYGEPEQLLQVNIADLYLDPAEGRRAIKAGSQPQTLEVRWRKKNGTTLWVELDTHALQGEAGQSGSCEGFVRDASKRRAAEEHRGDLERQLSQSQKMEAVGRLAGGIAHDFNNLLTSIAGYSDLLLSSLEPGDARRTHAEEIRKAGERAAGLTRQLLAFSRRQVLDPKVLDLNEVVSSMERMLRRVLGDAVRLMIVGSAEPCRVRADPGQIEQAILNLVVNARDAMPDGGDLKIETFNVVLGSGSPEQGHFSMAHGAYSIVAVADTGAGMSADVKARLFEPFFTTKSQGKGTGLGLSTTYGIVKQSGGYVWCDSEPGRGTRFEIYLPRVEQPIPLPEPAPAVATVPRNDEKILLVEDEPEVRQLVQKLLVMQGYDVVSAGNGDEALALLEQMTGPIDLMVTDVVMPGMSGRQLADRLCKTRPAMKLLFMSGFTDDAIVDRGTLLPGTAFLQKPFTPAALGKKVREVLDAPVSGTTPA
jgi:two-component system cell cycle sensor histidine kinase/response regulator CckA